MQAEPWDLRRFTLVRIIGRGYASRVYECFDKVSQQTMALKVYHKADLCPLNFHQIKREMLIHSSFKHPNILPIYATFDDAENIYMVLEYAAKGDLYNYLRHKGRSLTENQTAKYVVEPFLRTLHYLHSNDVIHRDIKPENLLVTSAGSLKLADFGLSIMYSDERPVTRVGTLDYMAPEVVRCPRKRYHDEWKDRLDLVYGPKADVWALGVLVFELILGRPPFKGATKEDIHNSILTEEPALPDLLSASCKDFISQCLVKEQRLRPTVNELMRHPWIASCIAAADKAAEAREQTTATAASCDTSICSSGSSSVPVHLGSWRTGACGGTSSAATHTLDTKSSAAACSPDTWYCGHPTDPAAHRTFKRKLSSLSDTSIHSSLCYRQVALLQPAPMRIAAHRGLPLPPVVAVASQHESMDVDYAQVG